jgi:hypothetical protein
MTASDERSDFDFMVGQWTVSHRRLNDRLVGCTEWTTFSGQSQTTPILAGFGNVEDNVLDLPEGSYRAAAFRSFDPKLGTWSIWWLDGRSPGALAPPVVGRFKGDVGEFYAEDTFRGRKIRIRFLWKRLGPGSARWEQAFAEAGTDAWETNWTMDFRRVL